MLSLLSSKYRNIQLTVHLLTHLNLKLKHIELILRYSLGLRAGVIVGYGAGLGRRGDGLRWSRGVFWVSGALMGAAGQGGGPKGPWWGLWWGCFVPQGP